jgi:hypothetical protein
MSPGTRPLLGLGLTFHPTLPDPTNNTNKTIERFKKDVQIFAFFRDKPPDERKGIHCIPTLNIKHDMWKSPKAREVIEGV